MLGGIFNCSADHRLVVLIGLHTPFYMLWLMLGAILFQMKMVVVGPVFNFWIHIWSDNLAAKKKLEENQIVNLTYFNVASVNSLILETFPQLLIQCVNSSLVSTWSTIGAVSIAMSGAYCMTFYI
jgi:ABC-type glycerol-3-phosphate transport system permease component